MLNVKKLALVALALAGTLGAGLAEARGRDDVQWSVTIGAPAPVYFGAPAPVYFERPAPVYYERPAPVFVRPAPLFVRPAPVFVDTPVHVYGRGYHHGRGHRSYRDADRDGIPNRYDPVYNPRWDRDGDGIPNRYDRYDNSRHHQGGHGGRWHGR